MSDDVKRAFLDVAVYSAIALITSTATVVMTAAALYLLSSHDRCTNRDLVHHHHHIRPVEPALRMNDQRWHTVP